MFHDVFGHVPLLADGHICTYLSALANFAHQSGYDPQIVEAVARLYWYTIELVKEHGNVKIYGAGILSSIGETEYCMSGKVKLQRFI